MKRYFSLLIALVLCVSTLFAMSGCSKEKIDIAFITSMDINDTGSAAANCNAGVVSFAQSKGLLCKTYAGSCAGQLEKALADGAETVVVFGVDDEYAVYNYAGKFAHIKFICVDFGNDFNVRPNIHCTNVSQAKSGAYAGYSAVKEGNKIIGVQGEETAETYNYLMGFVHGAQQAAVETGVSGKPVKIYYNVSGTDMAEERSQSWFENGCSVIFCSDGTYREVCSNISNSDLYAVMTFGADRTGDDERIAASVYGDYKKVMEGILEDAYSGSFNGGIMEWAGAGEGASGFSYDKERFEMFTDSDLALITEYISQSDIADSPVYKIPSDKGYSKIVLAEAGVMTQSEPN